MRPTRTVIALVAVITVLVASVFVGILVPSQRLGTILAPSSDGNGYGPGGYPITRVVTTTTATMTSIKPQTGESAPTYYTTPSEKMIIRTGTVSMEVSDARKAVSDISHLAESVGGYVSGSYVSASDERNSGWVSIRVPKDVFANVLEDVKSLGKVKDASTSSEDITEQYIDLKARLANLEAQEKVLRELLEKSVTVKDTLDVQAELGRVRGEIESLTGRIQYLEGNVEFSLITVNVSEPAPSTPLTSPFIDWGEVFSSALVVLYSMTRGLIIGFFALLPFIIIGTVIAIVWYWRVKKKQRSGATKPST